MNSISEHATDCRHGGTQRWVRAYGLKTTSVISLCLLTGLALYNSNHLAANDENSVSPEEIETRETDEQATSAAAEQPEFTTESIRGKVVWLCEALESLHDVRTMPDARERVLVVQTGEGELIPLIEDLRGRAFRQDERLRNREVELYVRRYQGVPFVQIIRTYTVKQDARYILDYWCEICAIAMYELKECDCCQGPIELRERKVE